MCYDATCTLPVTAASIQTLLSPRLMLAFKPLGKEVLKKQQQNSSHYDN